MHFRPAQSMVWCSSSPSTATSTCTTLRLAPASTWIASAVTPSLSLPVTRPLAASLESTGKDRWAFAFLRCGACYAICTGGHLHFLCCGACYAICTRGTCGSSQMATQLWSPKEIEVLLNEWLHVSLQNPTTLPPWCLRTEKQFGLTGLSATVCIKSSRHSADGVPKWVSAVYCSIMTMQAHTQQL